MSLKDVDKAKSEVASGKDEDNRAEPKVYESGYFLLSQQINSLRDSMDSKFEYMRKETDTKFSDLRKEMDLKFNKVDERFDKADLKFNKVDEKFDGVNKEIKDINKEIKDIRKEIGYLQRWSVALIITVILGFLGTIVVIAFK
ncbi:MAG: hypothetical protein GX759_00740 [Thermoanaerobacterales bacterium]|jgi:uncharacterized coiled-coil DUF342 family protein|nr:hypothetical protein [Thermoanaerobacterales bacterium]